MNHLKDLAYSLEKVEFEEDDDIAPLEEVEVDSDDDDDEEEDLEGTLRHLKKSSQDAEKSALSKEGKNQNNKETRPEATVQRIPEVVDDFVRNFLIKMNMMRTLEVFQNEWYELMHKGKLNDEDIGKVPDVYLLNQEIDAKVKAIRHELNTWKQKASTYQETSEQLKKERDFHRMHHKRVGQEKNDLLNEIKSWKQKYSQLKPQVDDLKKQYEVLRKEKVLLELERDKLSKKISEIVVDNLADALNAETPPTKSPTQTERANGNSTTQTSSPKKKVKIGGVTTVSALPTENRRNPWIEQQIPKPNVRRVGTAPKHFKAHDEPIGSIAMHPNKNIVATASDDRSWRMWSLQPGSLFSLIMEGAHKDWISDVDFHPQGTHLATSSADGEVKIWDFAKGTNPISFNDHKQTVWSCAFHDTGHFVVTASLDKTCKLFDLQSQKCKLTLRGHADSVNSVMFQPYTNLVATCSSDKTISLWDTRTGLCHQTFYGHKNSINHVAFNRTADLVGSTDTLGVAKIWDIRMVAERYSLQTGGVSANKATFDNSSSYFVVPTHDGTIKIYDLTDSNEVDRTMELRGHDSAVNAVLFDQTGEAIVSAGTDGMVKLWPLK